MAEMTGTRTEVDGWRPDPMSERVVVRCYGSFHDAKRAVDQLTSERIPRKRISVLGGGLRWREAHPAERILKVAAGGGAALTAAVAALLWSFGALDIGFSLVTTLIAGALVGGILGLVLGAIAWAATKRDPTVPETGTVDVSRYDVLVEIDDADRARRLLAD
jgi:hypothetical protein